MEDYRIRVRLFMGIIVVVLSVLGLRLAQMQIIDADEYLGEARSNAVKPRRVLPARGAIFDRGGELLVDNEPIYTLTITPRYFNPDRAPLLADLLGVADSVVTRKLEKARRYSPFQPSPVFREVPLSTFSRIRENQYMLPGVNYEMEEKRRYHTEARAAHALGYVREVTGRELERLRGENYRPGDLIGKAGLERNYESYLRGRMGSEFKLVNVRGLEVRPFQNGAEDAPPISGYSLHLGLDNQVQALAESLFVGKRGGAVALDPQSGEIISMVSAPDFDPALFSQSIDSETWRYLTTSPEKPMFNRATQMGMPPGSTWKPFMSLLALDQGILRGADDKMPCPGAYYLGNHPFRNHGSHAYGMIDVEKALEVSCNTFYFGIMMKTDVNTFSRYAHMFGFGERVPMDVKEQSAGLIPDSNYYNTHFPRGWTAGYSINLGIGQGDMVVTPMQLARYIAAVANEGTLYAPHLVRKFVNPETGAEVYPWLPEPEQIPIEKKNFEIVKEGMRRVMEEGTGYYAQIPGITSGGKTGTAENPHGKDHSIFVMFAPLDDPQIAVAVMVENAGYGATAAAPIASLMVEQYLTGETNQTRESKRNIRRALSAQSAPIEEGK